MIQEIMDRASQYYVGFTHLPIEGQVIAGAGVLVLVAALRNLWKLLFPVRWTAASLLRIAAFLVSPRGRSKSKKTDNITQAVTDVIPFDVSSKKKTRKTYAFYSTTPVVHSLTDEQIDVLDAARIKFGVGGNGGLGVERTRRQDGGYASANVGNVPFDLSTKKKAKATYSHYATSHLAHTLSDTQMALMSEAVGLYDIPGNGGLTAERERRHVEQRSQELQQAAVNPTSPPPFSFDTEEAAQATYDYYGGTDAVRSLTDVQMDLIDSSFEVYDIEKHGRLTIERNRRKMVAKAVELQNRTSATPVDTSALEARIEELETMHQPTTPTKKPASVEDVA